jgi:hypothetical protein
VAVTAIEPATLLTMKLCSELMDAQATVKRQQRVILAMAVVLRAQQTGSAALVDLVDALLADVDA